MKLISMIVLALAIVLSGCNKSTDMEESNTAGKKEIGAGVEDGIHNNEADTEENSMNKSYADHAEWAQEMLIKYYWNEDERFLNNAYPYAKEREKHLNYWWKAHGVDAMMDGYERTGDKRYTEKAEQIVKGIIVRNGSLYNEFYDDMEWLALSALRLYDATGSEEIKEYVLKLWKDIKTAWWEDDLGGMAWKKDERHKRNTCSNGPAAILASRLYERFGDEEDLELAKKIFAFMKENLVNEETGIVYDGLVLLDDGTLDVNTAWIFTYGQGTYLGSGVELYRTTGEDSYLKDAEKTAYAAIKELRNPGTDTIQDEGQGDGGLFKGILIRYLINLYKVSGNAELKEEIKKTVYFNSDALIRSSSEKALFGTSWDKPAPMPLDLPVQLSGVFLLEGAAVIEGAQ
jgi:predicted alpha-1,6-mannanase (GH76 family)